MEHFAQLSIVNIVQGPSEKVERILRKAGHVVIGVDEVGCGCLAGPVVAAALELPAVTRILGIQDSKLLTPEKRMAVFARIVEAGVRFSVAIASVEEINQFNIRQATLLAMRRAVCAFGNASFALVDAWRIPGITIEQRSFIRGDRLIRSIAAASIVAKVVRDRLMGEYDKKFPGFGFAVHKGYATALHQAALREKGPTPLHRPLFLRKLFSDRQIALNL